MEEFDKNLVENLLEGIKVKVKSIMRLIERLILKRLIEHLDKNNISIEGQSGFRKCRSTKDNLIFLVQKAKEAFNRKRKITCNIF